ncbi:MAG: hypothetical protein IJT91_00075 [Clostridia bacterium]|nr:hypothetical protein [Clostridia bacterium]
MNRRKNNGNKTIAFMSETYALKAQKVLAARGIYSYPVRLSEPTKRGCSHGLIIDGDNENAALSALMTAAVGRYDVLR